MAMNSQALSQDTKTGEEGAPEVISPPEMGGEKGISASSSTSSVPRVPAQPMSPQISPSELTPLRAHYLKKSLVSLQFAKELEVLSNPSSNPNVSILSYLGPPFTPPPKDATGNADLVFFSFIFRQFVLSFPFLATAPKNFFPQKLQPFVDSVLTRNLTGGYNATLTGSQEDAEELGRQKILHKLEKQLTLILGSSIKLAEKEDVVRLTQSDLDRLETLGRKRRERAGKVEKDIFEINVIGVRSVVEKGRMRSRAHDEFIVRTRRTGFKDIHVARRFGDFKTLWETLRKAHPMEDVPPPPGKDRSAATITPASSSMGYSSSMAAGGSSLSRTDTALSAAPSLMRTDTGLSTISMTQHKLSREKNRLTLRFYLNTLLTHPLLASSPVFRSFLTANPIKLSAQEYDDARRREEADQLREQGKIKFETEIKDRVEKLREAMAHIKADAMSKDGLTHIFSVIRQTSNVKELPPDYQAVLEWGRVSLASTIFQQFVAADAASESFAGLKRIHGLMPYMLLKGILRISNPVAMIRGVLDLFTAQPFGGKSLLQRMFTSSLQEEATGIQEDIAMVSEKVEDPVLCEKVRQYVYAPKEIQEFYKAEALEAKTSLLTVILRSSENPALSRAQLQRLARCSRAHAQYMAKKRAPDYDSDDDEGPSDEDGWLYEDLGVLLRLYGRLRDKEQMIALIFESTTAELLKDIITIFYAPLAQVYKAANIADSIGDLQNFVNDLIATVERVDALGEENPARTVQTFIDLVGRHEQAFYLFVHKVHSKGEGLFNSLTQWVELFITFMREGLGDPISLDFLLPHSQTEREAVLKEVDAVALYHYKLKVAHEEKVKRRFDSRVKDELDNAEEEAAQDLVDGVIGDLSIGELVQGELSDLDPSDSSEEEYESSEEGTSEEEPERSPRPHHPPQRSSTGTSSSIHAAEKTLPSLPPEEATAVPPPPPPKDATFPNGRGSEERKLPSRKKTLEFLHVKSSSGSSRPSPQPSPAPRSAKRKRGAPPVIKEPELKVIPGLLPVFLEMIRPKLRPRQAATS